MINTQHVLILRVLMINTQHVLILHVYYQYGKWVGYVTVLDKFKQCDKTCHIEGYNNIFSWTQQRIYYFSEAQQNTTYYICPNYIKISVCLSAVTLRYRPPQKLIISTKCNTFIFNTILHSVVLLNLVKLNTLVKRYFIT